MFFTFFGIVTTYSQFFLNQNVTVSLGNNVLVYIDTDLELSTGSNMTQSGTGTIYITGNWTNNGGTFNPGSGVVNIIGTGNSTISGSSSTTFYDLIINKNSTLQFVTLGNNVNISNDLRVLNGTLDLQTYSINALAGSNGTFELTANARLFVGGTNDLSTTINNYSSYTINTSSIINFNGANQTFTNKPTNLTQNFTTNTGGLGTVWLSNTGTKFANSPLLIRGNLIVYTGVTLQNALGVDALAVRGSIINNASILNEGVIEIGTEP